MTDLILFAVFPYVALSIAVVVTIHRYLTNRYSFSSGSTQFLANQSLFWGSIPWHYGILSILVAHLLAVLFPGAWASLVGEPVRLYVLEISGLALATMTVVGIVLLIWRRLSNRNVAVVTSPIHWVLLAALLVQVAAGLYIAVAYRWGSLWYLSSAVPWLVSLVRLDPQLQYITPLPWVFKLHAFNAFLLLGLLPFTQLVHAFTYPVTYLWRAYQVVIWNRRAWRPRYLPPLQSAATGRESMESDRPAAPEGL